MIRRNARLRREYMYRRSLEGKERERYEQKRKIRKALEEGKAIPTELAASAEALDSELGLEDEQTGRPMEGRVTWDSEYARAGLQDPKVFITTSRDASSRLNQFAKELQLVIPNSQKLNRGSHVIRDLVEACRANEATDLILVHEHRGDPDGLVISHLPHGPTAYFGLYNVVLRHDVEGAERTAVSQAYPHLIFNNLATKLGERVMAILKHLFPVPKEDSQRVITFANQDDYISFRHHTFSRKLTVSTSGDGNGDGEEEGKGKGDGEDKSTGMVHRKKELQLAELGPRFEMRPYQILLGTMENDSADVEWTLHAYTNTAKKKRVL